ncbi:MAG: phosphotransferase [Anaerolineae bacterium]|nr:MAG: phosphotransferase [Anaerolineae bacterium]
MKTLGAQDIVRILAHYHLGDLKRYQHIHRGYVNEKWVVETTEGRYLLKCRHPSLREPRLVNAQHGLMGHLLVAGFPVPALISTRYGASFLEVEGEVYEVQVYLAGVPCDPTRPAHLATAARTLGWYHDAVQGFDSPALHRPAERYGPRALGQIVEPLKKSWRGRTTAQLDLSIEELQGHARDLEARFREFGPLLALVIHSDYYADNLIFQGDRVVGVIDFDLAHWCWRAMEVAEALLAFTTERCRRFESIVYRGLLDLDVAHQFLAAYAETTELSEGEIRALPHLIRTIWLCASLDPPLETLLSPEQAPQAMPEILALAGWARAHAADIVEAAKTCSNSRG